MLRDLHYALRTLRNAPAFAVTVILTLGVGLGLNTTLFTLFNTYILRPFAISDPYSLYSVRWSTPRSTRGLATWEQYLELKANKAVFTDAVACIPLLARFESRNLVGMAVSGNYFRALGVAPQAGRPILDDDNATPGTGAVTVLSYQLWKAQFNQDAGVIGRTVRISGKPFEVIGIAPERFTGIAEFPVDFYVPLTVQSAVVAGPDIFSPEKPPGVLLIGILRHDVTVLQAEAALTNWIRHATESLPQNERAIRATLTSRATPVSLDPEILSVFIPLLVVFGLVLLICCANVSNMMLARGLARQREIGVRLALGAARSRLIRQLLSENFLLALLAGAVGFAISLLTIRGAQRLMVSTIPPSLNLIQMPPLDPDYRMFFFVLSAAALTTIACGLAPALQATRTSLIEALRGEFGTRISASRLRSLLVVSQISVCLILLVLTGILLRSSGSYQHMDPGYNPHGITYPLFIGRSGNVPGGKLAQELLTAQWIDSLAAAARAPLRSSVPASITPAESTQALRVLYNIVSPEYFTILQIPILRGRNFVKAEADSEGPVAIISQATAQKLWPNQDAPWQVHRHRSQDVPRQRRATGHRGSHHRRRQGRRQ